MAIVVVLLLSLGITAGPTLIKREHRRMGIDDKRHTDCSPFWLTESTGSIWTRSPSSVLGYIRVACQR